MTKRILVYVAMVVSLIIGGIVASVLLFGEEAADVLPDAPLVNDKLLPKRTGVHPKENKVPVDDQSAFVGNEVRVLEVEGEASSTRGVSKEWEKLKAGKLLGTDERIRTGNKSHITLGMGEDSKLELAEHAEVEIGNSNKDDRKFKLVRGRISVAYKEEDRKLKIENHDGSAVAEAEEGVFTVLNTGTTVAVATKTGAVDLVSGGERVVVHSGKQSVAANGAPSTPRPISVDVMLRVVDPGCRVQREAFVMIHGRTDPGAAVFGNDTKGVVRPDGKFKVQVPLKVGKNKIVVVTEDAAGNRKRRVFQCITVDPGAPIKKIDINWGPAKNKEQT